MSTITDSTSATVLDIEHEIQIDASPSVTFQAVLTKLGPENGGEGGVPMPMVLEAFPGGRWYRDLGEGQGHLWGHVQAIKTDQLIEIFGPLFMSFPVTNNLQYRLEANEGGTLLRFRHTGHGLIPEGHRGGLAAGWEIMMERVKESAEAAG